MSRASLAILVASCAAVTLTACYLAFFYSRTIVPESDGVRWDQLARSFAAGTGLQPPDLPRVMDREPFYAVFAGMIYRFFGSRVSHVLLAQSVILVLALTGFAWALSPMIGIFSAAAVSLLTVAAPGVAAMAVGNLLSETIALPLLVLACGLFASGLARNREPFYIWLAGMTLGAIALTRYIFYPLPFLLIAGLFLLKKRLGVTGLPGISAKVLGGFFIPVIIWTAYVSSVLGSFTPFGTKGGAELLLNARRAELTGKNLFAYAIGSVLGDAAGRRFFDGYAQNVEPYFGNRSALRDFDANLVKEGQAVSTNASASRQALQYILMHPFRFSVIAIGEFFIRNSPMLWHNAADMRHLFAETHPELPEWFRIASVAAYRLIFIGLVLFALYSAVRILLRPSIPIYLFFPALTVLSVNALHFFFDSVPRHALPLYPLYFLLCVVGIKQLWRPIGNSPA